MEQTGEPPIPRGEPIESTFPRAITGWPRDFRTLGPAALGCENRSVNQLSPSGMSGFYGLSPLG